jgi:cytochrome c oxidase cbb3-type subunit 3
VKQPSIIEKLNASVAVEKEEDIMLDHNYDGIRELDNNLPPWWKYGFYITIVWAVIYMIHFHVSNTGKLQLAEYEDQLAIAKAQVEEYRKKAANLVDENNAVLLTDQASLAAGQSVFMDNCAACHGRAGEGGVGPNLTDDYWLHSGSIGAVFKTIKYGYPEKGMKAWQQDLGAKQIHEVSSFIMSLRGTNPANAKEKQGELYINSAVVDSAATATVDSSLIVLTGK